MLCLPLIDFDPVRNVFPPSIGLSQFDQVTPLVAGPPFMFGQGVILGLLPCLLFDRGKLLGLTSPLLFRPPDCPTLVGWQVVEGQWAGLIAVVAFRRRPRSARRCLTCNSSSGVGNTRYSWSLLLRICAGCGSAASYAVYWYLAFRCRRMASLS